MPETEPRRKWKGGSKKEIKGYLFKNLESKYRPQRKYLFFRCATDKRRTQHALLSQSPRLSSYFVAKMISPCFSKISQKNSGVAIRLDEGKKSLSQGLRQKISDSRSKGRRGLRSLRPLLCLQHGRWVIVQLRNVCDVYFKITAHTAKNQSNFLI